MDIEEFPATKAWREGIYQRPAVKKGLRVPVRYPFSDDLVMDPKRKEWYDMIQKHGKEIIKKESQELAKSFGKL